MIVYNKDTNELAVVIYASYDSVRNCVEATLDSPQGVEYYHTYENTTEAMFLAKCKSEEWWKTNRPELCI